MTQIEPYVPDYDVLRVQQKAYTKFPILLKYKTDFVTTRIQPPFKGLLPDGTTGWTKHALVQFICISDHPRPIQAKMGVRHGTVATAFQQAYDKAVRDMGTFVVGGKPGPLEDIFWGVLQKHLWEMDRLSRIINDAIPDSSKPKSALDAL